MTTPPIDLAPRTHDSPIASGLGKLIRLPKRAAAAMAGCALWAALIGWPAGYAVAAPDTAWPQRLQAELARIDARHPADIGVYVRDLATGVSISYRAGERWYLASTVKVIVAIALLRGIENGLYTLNTPLTLEATDYVDGAGDTNSYAPGSSLRVRYLLDQMIIFSDNTASDLLIRLLGIDAVNATVQSLVPQGFERITSLSDVRRLAYSNLTPAAVNLRGADFLLVRRQPSDVQRLKALSLVLGQPSTSFRMPTVGAAWDAYYATGLNSGRLDSYGELLALLAEGKALNAENTAYLLDVMSHVKTGMLRIKAGLPPSVHFAHKTGTQRSRTCDSGLLTTAADDGGKRIVIAACTSHEPSGVRADRALRDVGEALCRSGLFNTEGSHERSCLTSPALPSRYDAAER